VLEAAIQSPNNAQALRFIVDHRWSQTARAMFEPVGFEMDKSIQFLNGCL